MKLSTDREMTVPGEAMNKDSTVPYGHKKESVGLGFGDNSEQYNQC